MTHPHTIDGWPEYFAALSRLTTARAEQSRKLAVELNEQKKRDLRRRK